MRYGKREISNAIKLLAGTHDQDTVSFIFANVDTVDLENEVCYCTPTSGKSTTQISADLTAEIADGVLIIPTVGSTVGILKMINQVPFIFFYSQIDGYSITIDTNGGYVTLQMNTDGTFQLNDGTHGGLVKVMELTSKLNAIENDLNTLKQAFSAWVVAPNDGGAALKAIAANWYNSIIVKTQQSEIENKNIVHGEPQ